MPSVTGWSACGEGKQPGWWQSYELEDFNKYVGLEEAAVATKNFQSTAVPGLLTDGRNMLEQCTKSNVAGTCFRANTIST